MNLFRRTADAARVLAAEDRIEIMNLSARVDNGLDGENVQKVIAAFTPDGVLAGCSGEAKVLSQIRGYAFMPATFARNRRHVVTDHEITVTGATATMFSYLTVFDRTTNRSIGTATFTDDLVRAAHGWAFKRRTLHADANACPIIHALQAAH